MSRRRETAPSEHAAYREIVFFIEGGCNKRLDVEFRNAFHRFFSQIEESAREKRIRFRVTLEGSRRSAYERFCEVIAIGNPETLPVLLVDSE